MNLYRLHWRNTLTGESGCGSLRYPQSTAENIASKLNRAPKMMQERLHFWAEPVAEQAARPSYKARQRGQQ